MAKTNKKKGKHKGISLEVLGSGNLRAKVSYTDIDGTPRKKSITGATELEVYKKIEDFKAGRLVEDKMTVRKAIRRYIDAKSSTLQPTTLFAYEGILRNTLQGLMDKDIHSIKPYDVQRAINADAKRGKSYKTIKNAIVLVKSALLLNNAPLPRYKYTMPPRNKQKAELPPFEDLLKVINNCEDETVKLAALLSLNCGGMRVGEVRGLQYGDIFEQNGKKYIHIQRQRTYASGHELEKRLKTESSERDVPLPDYLYKMIMAKPHENDTDFIINESYKAISGRFKRLMERNGISNFTFHGLRKEFATTMSLLGVQKEALQLLGGWANSVILDSVYICTPKEAAEKGILQLGDVMAKTISSEVKND